MAITIGLVDFKGAVTGLRLQSVTYGETGSPSEALDEDGNVEQINFFGRKKTIQCEGNVVTGGDLTALTVGGTLTISGVAYIIESLSIKESVNGIKTCSISGSAPMPATASE